MSNERKIRRVYLEWWTIKKTTIYTLVVLLALVAAAVFGYKYFWQNNNSVEQGGIPLNAAKIMSFEGDVRIVRAATRETERVVGTVYVSAGDTVQTQSDGRVQLQMIDGSTLTVKPNSTVIIRDNTSILGGTTVKVSLGDGQINVKTEDQGATSNNIVEVKQVENKVSSQTDANFGINTTTNSGEIRISRGSVESTVNGEKTVIKNGEYASIGSTGKISPREKLIEAPKLLAPNALEQYFVSNLGNTNVTLRWQPSESTSSYRAEVATSPFFVAEGMINEKDNLATTNLTVAKIVAGNYFWRVRSVTKSGQNSEWSEPRKFIVSARDTSGVIKIEELRAENIGGNLFIISGKTSSGAVIRVLGRETIAVADGSFKLQAGVSSGEVIVEAVGEQGGKTRYSLSIASGKFSRIN
jgi:FecR protein